VSVYTSFTRGNKGNAYHAALTQTLKPVPNPNANANHTNPNPNPTMSD